MELVVPLPLPVAPLEPLPLQLELPLPPPLPPSRETQPEEPRFVVVDLGETGDWIQL
jgi:hypothetical protein